MAFLPNRAAAAPAPPPPAPQPAERATATILTGMDLMDDERRARAFNDWVKTATLDELKDYQAIKKSREGTAEGDEYPLTEAQRRARAALRAEREAAAAAGEDRERALGDALDRRRQWGI